MRVVGLDFGSKRIGVAVSDSRGRLALPSKVFHRAGKLGEDMYRLGQVVMSYEPSTVVVGIPTSLSGEIGPQARLVSEEIEILRSMIEVPVIFQDERLTTRLAHMYLNEAGHDSRARRLRVDESSAAIILQDWLDTQRAKTVPSKD